MFTGLGAFSLTPLVEGEIAETLFISLITHLAETGVNSTGVLGSTGNYAYLNSRIASLRNKAAGEPCCRHPGDDQYRTYQYG